jgi:hypothetical protein
MIFILKIDNTSERTSFGGRVFSPPKTQNRFLSMAFFFIGRVKTTTRQKRAQATSERRAFKPFPAHFPHSLFIFQKKYYLCLSKDQSTRLPIN